MADRIPRPLLILALLAIFALGLALGTNAFVASKLTVSPERLAAAKAGAPTPRSATAAPSDAGDGPGEGASGDAAVAEAVSKSRRPATKRVGFWKDPIVRRNIFDSTNAIAGKPPEPEKDPDAEGEVDKQSDLAATLIATSVASDPIWSTALISTDDGTNVYRIDEKILDATIKDIQRPTLERAARVILLRGGELEYLEAGGKAKKKTSKASKKDDKPKKKTNNRGKRDWDIKKTGDNQYDVAEDDVKWALDNLDKMSREARVVPNFADGQTNGFKVFAIRRNSALRKMGLKNNDVLTGVNGYDLSNTEKALEIYGKLQSEKSFSLEVLRNGEPVTMEYNIR